VPCFQEWERWYSQYLSKQIFVSKDGTPGSPSKLFEAYFTQGHVGWLGRVNRFSNYRSKECFNEPFFDFFKKFKHELNCDFPKLYRKARATWEAGFRSAAKYDRPQPQVNEVAWNMSYDWTMLHFSPHMSGSRISSLEDALSNMNMKSSVGFPWNLEFHSKTEFLDSGISVLDDYWDVIAGENVDRIVPIWSSTVKVELRHIEKLADYGALYDKLRTFTASPFEHSASCNRMYVDQNNRFYDTVGKHWSFVGGSKYFRGFDAIFTRLNKHPNAFCLDESSFDASLFRKIMEGVRDMRWEFLDPVERTTENWNRHMALYDSIINTVIVLETGDLVQKDTGNPSGSGNTIVDNTLNLFRLLAYAYIMLCFEMGIEPSYTEFMNFVEAVLNGDDNTFTVADNIVSWFNARNIARIWLQLGVVTTPSNDIWEPRKLADCDFLSHKFVFTPRGGGCWLPVPETEKVLSSLVYGSDYNDVRWHLLRAYALRIDSWPNLQCRFVIAKYINYLNQAYADSLVGSVQLNDKISFSMDMIKSIYKNDMEIEQLYIGQESRPLNGFPVQESSSFKILKNIYSVLDYNCADIGTIFPYNIEEKQSKMVSKNTRRNRALARMAQSAGSLTLSNGVNVQSLAQRERRKRQIVNQPPPLPPWPVALTGNPKKKRRNRARRLNRGTGRLGLGGSGNDGFSKKSRIIRNEEYICEVLSSVNLNPVKISCNPGLSNAGTSNNTNITNTNGPMSWGSKESILYEKYKIRRFEWIYRREVSEFNTAGDAGKVVLQHDYDPSDAAPNTKQQMMDSVPHKDGMPCTPEIRLKLNPDLCNGDFSGKYIRSGLQPANTDVNKFDFGNFYIATIGQGANGTVVGELHCSYEIELIDPVSTTTPYAPITNYVSNFTTLGTGEQLLNSGVVQPFALTANTVWNGLGLTPVAGVFTLPAGNYIIIANSTCTDTTNTDLNDFQLILQRNGANYGINAEIKASSGASLGVKENLVATWFVISNGSTTINLNWTAVLLGGSAANTTATCSLLIQSV